MRGEVQFTTPELVRVLGARLSLGVGLGLLLGNLFTAEQRRAVGWTLLLSGACTATSIAMEMFGRPRAMTLGLGSESSEHETRFKERERLAPAGV